MNADLIRKMEQYMDHTLLKADANSKDIQRLCDEAVRYGFYAVCVNPCHISSCKEYLKGTRVKIATVVGFPLGATFSEIKVAEAKMSVLQGADEVDMVMNVGHIKDKDYDEVTREIRAVKDAVGDHPLKVIIETCLLTPEEIVKAAEIVLAGGADFVKTSTGFGAEGAKIEDVDLIAKTVSGKVGIKASGGIRSAEAARRFILHGATRLGVSSSVAIMNEVWGISINETNHE